MTARKQPVDLWANAAQGVKNRSAGLCECRGECAEKVCAGGRCVNRHQVRALGHRGAVAFLTVVALDKDRGNVAGSNLRAYCQWCLG